MAALVALVVSLLARVGVTSEAVYLGSRPLPVLCPVRRVTGHRCPGCGMTRALLLVSRGDLRTAFTANRCWPVLVLVVVHATIITRRRNAV